MTVNNCDKNFVVALFKGLNTKGIRYAVGGDYERLPDAVGHDIDLWTLMAFVSVFLVLSGNLGIMS